MDKYSKVEKLLRNYNMLKINIQNLEQEIAFIKDDITLKGVDYDSISVSPTNEIKSVVENEVLSRTEKIEYLEHIIKRHRKDIEKLERALEGLEDIEHTIVVEKYINAKQWWQVASIVRFNERWCRELRKRAIDKLVVGIYGDRATSKPH